MNDRTQRAQDWCFLTGRIAAMEARLITNDFMQRMADGKDINALFLSVSDTAYKNDFPIIEKLHESDSIIGDVYHERLHEIMRFSPEPSVAAIFMMQAGFQHYKGYLKNRLAGMELAYGNRSTISDEQWQRVYDDLKTDLPEFWYEASAVIRANVNEEKPEQIPQVIDLVLDSEYLVQQVNAAEAIGYDLVKKWAEGQMLVKTVEILWRAKLTEQDPAVIRSLFLRGRLNASLYNELLDLPVEEWPARLKTTALEPIVDEVFAADERERITSFTKRGADLILGWVRPARFAAFGPHRIFGYLCGLQAEAFNLRLLLAGKVNKISTTLLQARLREQYV